MIGKLIVALLSIAICVVALIVTGNILVALFFLVMPWVLMYQRYRRKQQRTIYVKR